MGYPTKVQLIQRKASEQWYINFPSAVAQAMEFTKGELVEWIIEDKANLIVHRTSVPDSPVKVLIVPTNEELAIAHDTFALVNG